MEGPFMETRLPNWERGVGNILFVLQEFRKLKPSLDWGRPVLIGHSNGGDMTMLFASKYPRLVDKALSMDHRRMVMPRVRQPRLCTRKGCDDEAEGGALPGTEEQGGSRIRVIRLEGVIHSGMEEKGTEKQHGLISRHVLDFIR